MNTKKYTKQIIIKKTPALGVSSQLVDLLMRQINENVANQTALPPLVNRADEGAVRLLLNGGKTVYTFTDTIRIVPRDHDEPKMWYILDKKLAKKINKLKRK